MPKNNVSLPIHLASPKITRGREFHVFNQDGEIKSIENTEEEARFFLIRGFATHYKAYETLLNKKGEKISFEYTRTVTDYDLQQDFLHGRISLT
jgi:hypothetical protein